MTAQRLNLMLRLIVAALAAVFLSGVQPAKAANINYPIGFTSQLPHNADSGVSTKVFAVGPSYTLTATGYMINPYQLRHLYGKVSTADETGLGLVGTTDHEIDTNSFIQLDVKNLRDNGFTSMTLYIGSVQSGESFSIYGSNTAGGVGINTLLSSGAPTGALSEWKAVENLVTQTYRYYFITGKYKDVLIEDKTFATIPQVVLSSLAGFVYYDKNNNGAKETGEPGIPGATVTLTGSDDHGAITPQVATTDANGAYSFPNLRPGTYTITETQPAGYLDGKDMQGTPGTGTTGNDVFTNITLAGGVNGVNNNFGELKPGSLSGFVYVDSNNDGHKQSGETPLNNVTLTLTGTNDLGAIAPQTQTTDSNGAYSFTNLRPGTYTVSETQPVGYVDELDAKNDVVIAGSNATDVVAGIPVLQETNSPNNNFGELIFGTVAGTVYCDENANSMFDVGDKGHPAQVSLMSGATVVATMSTDANGIYKFTSVTPGSYTVHVPGSSADATLETSNDLAVTVTGNVDTTGVNFGYLPTPINFLLENGTPMLGAPQPGGVPLTQGSLFGQAFFVPDLAHVSDLTALGAGSVPGATIGLSDLFTAAPGLYAYSGPLPDFPELGTYTGFVFLYEPLLSVDAWHNTSVTNLIAVLHSAGASGDLVNDSYTFRFQTNQVFAGPGTAYNYQATGVTVLEDTPVSGAFIGIKTDAAFLLNPVYVGASLTPPIPLGNPGSAGVIPAGWMARAIGEFTVPATPSRINVHFSGTYQNICGDLFGFEICPPAWLGQ